MEKQDVDVQPIQRNLLPTIQQSKGGCGCAWWYPCITKDWDRVALGRGGAFEEQMQFASQHMMPEVALSHLWSSSFIVKEFSKQEG